MPEPAIAQIQPQPDEDLWTPTEIAEFLLNNSLSEEEYRRNLREVIAMGIDPLTPDPAHLFRDDGYQRAEAHPDIVFAGRVLSE